MPKISDDFTVRYGDVVVERSHVYSGRSFTLWALHAWLVRSDPQWWDDHFWHGGERRGWWE